MKSKVTPKFCKFKIPEKEYANKAAEYLNQVRWKKNDDLPENKSNPEHYYTQNKNIKDEQFHIKELNFVISLFKNNKTPGPDSITSEFIKWFDDKNRILLLETINATITDNHWEDSLNLARVASIYKKGDRSNLANYRPISLLQTFYKIIASLIKERIAATIDVNITKTQYGFRRKKSTAQAIYLARRLLDISEVEGTNLTMVLLDWEKAFDKIDHFRMLEALNRLGIKGNLFKLITRIYTSPKFKVSVGNIHSEYNTQQSGIRQGCPLSPYLFVLVMTVMFKDIRSRLNTPKQREPINNIKSSEILYADDTLIFGTHTQSINKLLKEIQKESQYYNTQLNLNKCINLTANRKQSNIQFSDGTLLNREHKAVYLGATLSDRIDNRGEISNKLAECNNIAKKLKLFWNTANTNKK